MAYRILAIDDDDGILRLIKNILVLSGYEVVARKSLDKIDLCDFTGFDLILLDVMMPVSGLDICRRIRKEIDVPILFVTAKDMEDDLIDGIQAGADDYITKPFTVKEFLARIRMHLRREERHKAVGGELCFGEVRIDARLQSALIKGGEVRFTKREFAILQLLAGNAGRVFSIEEIYDRVYPGDSDTQFRSVSEYIYQIRSKFKSHGLDPFETVRGGGYRWNIR